MSLKIFLKPGELYIGKEPAVVSTILGSCVSITMFSAKLGAGGICHALLPRKFAFRKRRHDFHYVDKSVLYMLGEFKKMGAEANEIEVKIFGGAGIAGASYRKSVGKANVEMAFNTVKDYDLKVVTWNLGGTSGRKIIFFTHTGRVLLRMLENN
jgi:chemotaxis protein CheD